MCLPNCMEFSKRYYLLAFSVAFSPGCSKTVTPILPLEVILSHRVCQLWRLTKFWPNKEVAIEETDYHPLFAGCLGKLNFESNSGRKRVLRRPPNRTAENEFDLNEKWRIRRNQKHFRYYVHLLKFESIWQLWEDASAWQMVSKEQFKLLMDLLIKQSAKLLALWTKYLPTLILLDPQRPDWKEKIVFQTKKVRFLLHPKKKIRPPRFQKEIFQWFNVLRAKF